MIKGFTKLLRRDLHRLYQTGGKLWLDQNVRAIHVSSNKRMKKRESISPFKLEETWDIHEMRDEYVAAGISNQVPILVENNEVEWCIIGGGIMGQALGFNLWKCVENRTLLKSSKHNSIKGIILEQDPSMKHSSTMLSAASIRQQYSHPHNIQMSMESAEFFKNLKTHLQLIDEPEPDISFNPQGYLFLATGKGQETLMKNHVTQLDYGAKVNLMDRAKLKETFPWLNVDDIEMASYGLENEGWFDAHALHSLFKKKNKTLGIDMLEAKVVGLKREIMDPHELFYDNIHVRDRVCGVYVTTPTCDIPIFIKCAFIFNCAGPWAGEVTDMLGVGPHNNIEECHESKLVKLPVRPEKRYVYTFHCPDGPMFDCPMVIDPTGLYFRREGTGGMYICGMPPLDPESVDNSNLDVDYDFFHEEIWPRLAHRVPVFEKLKLKSAWAGYYDYNTLDQNAVIGAHPYYRNFHFLNGFSGHGLQMAYSASRALINQFVLENAGDTYDTVNPVDFSFDRIVEGRPIRETNIV